MYGFPKIIEFEEISPSGEPTIQLVRPGDVLGHTKTASEALDYIKNVKPIPGKTIILVLAMTAGEFYGPNRNGDAWPERPLRIKDTVITEDDVLPKHYHTFETLAKVFKHHINKDPSRSIGDVLKAFYNWPMHRVELLIALDNDKASDIVQEIEKGNNIAVSMGCRVRFDACSICGNKAPTRRQYCDHAKYHLGELLPNGKKIFVWNPSPKFFDISIVRRPADRLGFMMKKVAEVVPLVRSSAFLGEYVDNINNKIATLKKMNLIRKILKGQVVGAKDENGDVRLLEKLKPFVEDISKKMPPIPDDVIRELIKHNPAVVLSTLSSMGILMTTPEFLKYLIWKINPNINLDPEIIIRIMALQGEIYRLFAENPELIEDLEQTGIFNITPDKVDSGLAEKLSFLMEKRSQWKEYLYRHYAPKIFQPTEYGGMQDVVTVRDPRTGRVYQTTRYAQRRASDTAGKEQLKSILGGTALLAGGLGILAAPFGRLGLLAGIPLTLAGGHALAENIPEHPYAYSTEGRKVYLPWKSPSYRRFSRLYPGGESFAGTEMIEKRSFAEDLPEVHLMLKTSMELQQYPQKIEDLRLPSYSVANFDEAARMVGNILI